MGLFDAIEGSYIDYTATSRTPRASFVDALSQAAAPSDARHIGALRQLEGIHGEMLKTGSDLGKRAATFEAAKHAQVAAIMRSAEKEGGVSARKLALSASIANQGVQNQLTSDYAADSLNMAANLQNIRKRRAHVASLIKGAGEVLAFGASKFGEDEPTPYGADYDEETKKRLAAMKELYKTEGTQYEGPRYSMQPSWETESRSELDRTPYWPSSTDTMYGSEFE